MFDAFPFNAWPPPYGDGPEDMSAFWTFGGEGSAGTWILTILGFVVMLTAFWGFVILENRKLTRQAARLRELGALERPERPGAAGPSGAGASA
ncbi:MAG TPA: hypothetical protein VNJ46_00095 [Gaiellaceae bacterium]|nr:hypothetical protein [Gaiellaceae bacterium]